LKLFLREKNLRAGKKRGRFARRHVGKEVQKTKKGREKDVALSIFLGKR